MISSLNNVASKSFAVARSVARAQLRLQQPSTLLQQSRSAQTHRHISPLHELFERMSQDITTLEEYGAQPSQSSHLLDCGVSEDALRFSTTHYGRLLEAPHVHANEHKVVMTVSEQNLGLSSLELDILQEVVGPDRFHKGVLRLSSNQFGSRIENKRHLVSMLDRIVNSCRRLGQQVEQETEKAA